MARTFDRTMNPLDIVVLAEAYGEKTAERIRTNWEPEHVGSVATQAARPLC